MKRDLDQEKVVLQIKKLIYKFHIKTTHPVKSSESVSSVQGYLSASEIYITVILPLLIATEKAYGGCHNCYGKGYCTYRSGTRWLGDFEGEVSGGTPIKTDYIPCDKCDRGTQFKSIFENILLSLQKEGGTK